MRLAPIGSRRLCLAMPPWYYKRVLRLAPLLAVWILVTACGKSVPVAQRTPSNASRTTPDSELKGQASYYAEPYHGRPTASGEIFDTYKDMTAAHRTLPFNTLVRVTNEENGRNVDVRINDRGPFVKGRVIDVSLKAARELDMVRAGVAPVKLTILSDSKKEPQEKAKRETTPSTPSAALYTIQVAALSSQDAAESLKSDLEKRYRDVTIESFTTAVTYYRVRVGRLTDLASADSLMKLLRDEKFGPFVVRLN